MDHPSSGNLLKQTLNHKESERIVFDMGSNAVTGIHVKKCIQHEFHRTLYIY